MAQPKDVPPSAEPETTAEGVHEKTATVLGPATAQAVPGSNSPTLTGGALQASAATALPAGRVLSDRYELLRFIAAGGMGEVYEARDRKLQGTVALKTIRGESAENQKAVDRFLREIHLARRVTHPNVCRLYDVDEDGTLLFLTMELLEGETLSRRLRRGRLQSAEALDLVRQIAAGLDAAHAAGIIHRDFKSGNIMLVPRPAPRPGFRAVITDFGLARHVDGDALASISDTGDVVGTPAYMAPEQVEGKAVTAAADLYSFGIVMYEMLTGRRPFEGGSAMSVALKRLREAPAPPRTLVADLDPAWEAAILRCLERDPADRFASAMDIVRALGGEAVSEGSGSAAILRRKRQAGVWTAVAAALLLGIGTGAWLWRRAVPAPANPMPAASAPVVAARRTLAVLGLRNVSAKPDAEWIGTALAEMLASDFAAGEKLHVLAGQRVGQARVDLGLSEGDVQELPSEAVARVRRALGADLLLVGGYTVLGPAGARLVRIDLRLQDGVSGAILASGSATGAEGRFFDVVSRAAGPLRAKLELPAISGAESLQVEAALPVRGEAARLYADGLARLRRFDAAGAQAVLEKAVAEDPKHPLPHAARAAAWLALGYQVKAHEEAKQAVSLAQSLSREQRLGIDALLHETVQDWPKAIETYAELTSLFPDELDYRLRLADAQISAGRPKEALATGQALERLPPPASTDPRVDLAIARAHEFLGQASEQRSAAARAAERALGQGLRDLAAHARLVEAVALTDLGERDKAMAAAEEARQLAEAVGDRHWAARALEQMSTLVEAGGDLDGGFRLNERALAVHRETGDMRGVGRVLQNEGLTRARQGRITDAQKLYDEALATFRRIGARYEEAATLNNVAMRLQLAGDLNGASRRYQQALALLGDVGERSGMISTLSNIGEIAYATGDLAQAEEMYKESLALCRELGEKGREAYRTFRLGEVAAARGDLVVARQRYQEALGQLDAGGDRINAGLVRLALAGLELAESKPAAAVELARRAEEVLRNEGAKDEAALAQARLAEALLAGSDIAGARAAAEAGSAAAAHSEDRRVRLLCAVIAARLRAASGVPAERAAAIEALDATAREAGRAGFVLIGLEARLAAGAVEAAAGRSAAARQRLKAVAGEAKAKGLGLIARQAEAS
jgi:tetratricopeptide (TPR) repeat protein